MKPAEQLRQAHALMQRTDLASAGSLARGCTLLTRQALEHQVNQCLIEQAPGALTVPFRVRLLCLQHVLANDDLVHRIAYTWSALSEATHHHGYELPPTPAELAAWTETVAALIEAADAQAGPS